MPQSPVRVVIVRGDISLWSPMWIDADVINDELCKVFECTQLDYYQVSPVHTFYSPCDAPAKVATWKALVRSTDDGARLVDVTDDDMRELPHTLVIHENARRDFKKKIDALRAAGGSAPETHDGGSAPDTPGARGAAERHLVAERHLAGQ